MIIKLCEYIPEKLVCLMVLHLVFCRVAPFCMNMYLDMVNTTGGAIAWAFLKPMLMGQILYTPDTPVTRAIMEKVHTLITQPSTHRVSSLMFMNYVC